MLKQKQTQPVDLFSFLNQQAQRQFELNNYILLKRDSSDPEDLLDYIEYITSIEKLYDWTKVPFTWTDTLKNTNVTKYSVIFEKANQLYRYGAIIYNAALPLANDQALAKFRNALWAFESIPFDDTEMSSDLTPDYVNHLICLVCSHKLIGQTKAQAYKCLYQFVTEEYNTTLIQYDQRFQKAAMISEAAKLFKQAFQLYQNQQADLLFRYCEIAKNIEQARLYFRDYKVNRNYDNNFIGLAIGYILVASQLASVEKGQEFYNQKETIEKLSHDLDGVNRIIQQKIISQAALEYPHLITKYIVKQKAPRVANQPIIQAPQQQQDQQQTQNKYPQLDKPAVGLIAQIGKGPSLINNPLLVSMTECVKPAVSAINVPPVIKAPSIIENQASNDPLTKTQNIKPEEFVPLEQQQQPNQYKIKIDSQFQTSDPQVQTPSFQTAQFSSGASQDEIQELINRSRMLQTSYIKPIQEEYEIEPEQPLQKPNKNMIESERVVPEESIGAQCVRSYKAHPSWK